ncbi:MAG: hypothetical protein DRN29_09345, partial [Thermoplasmata archaeon]
TIIVVFDNDPEDHFNEPSVERLLDLERPDDPTLWVDYFSLYNLDPWGHAIIIATYNDNGTVGAVTSEFDVYKVTDNEGTKDEVTQDGLTIDIPQGAVSFSTDGLIIVKVPKLIEDATVEPVTPVGDPVMVSFFNYYCGSQYTFQNGLRAWVTMTYDESLLPEGVSEEDLRVALWNESGRYWTTSGLQDFSVDTEANTIDFSTRTTGTFSVVAYTTFRITTPVIVPRCGDYTGPFPTICTVIEDLLNGVNEDEIKLVLSGPAEDPIFDDLTIYYGEPSDGWSGDYDDVSHMLCLELDEDYDLLGSSTTDGGWSGYGLPGGTYTLDIYAVNNAGDSKHLEHTFVVDATAPAVDFIGTYIAANPTFFLDLSDAESGVDEETIFMDIYAVRHSGYETEYKEYLGTATPSSMQFDWDEGVVTVTFDQMTYGFTLADEMAVDVILYDGDVTMRIDDGDASSYYYYFCDDDDQQCRGYLPEDGVADCAGNHANPVWRRYTVDAVPPSMKLVSAEGASQIEIEVTDTGSGIDPDKFLINGVPLSESDYDWTWTPTSSSSGILRIDVGEGPVDIDITATDAVGNFAVLEVEEGAEVVDLIDVKSYPNPFDPYNGEYARIEYTLTKGANVTIAIYDFAGEKVKTVFDGYRSAGTYTDKWYGVDESGKTVASGAYIGYVKVDDGSKTVTKNLKIGVYKGGND